MNLKVFSDELLNGLISEAQQSPRTRQHLNIHQSYSDPCQRLFNAIGFNSYIRPHRHSLDPKAESLFAIRGEFALVLFGQDGTPEDVVFFSGGGTGAGSAVGVELAPGAWHTVVSLSEWAVLLELKGGPFNSNAAKEPAPWAPEEGSAEAPEYLISLRKVIAASVGHD